MDYRHPVQAVIPGVQGHVLAVLAATDTELTMRTVAKLAGVSVNRAVSVLNGLIELGIVRRRDAGRSALVALDRENEVGRLVTSLGSLRTRVVDRMRKAAQSIRPRPTSIVLFGSLVAGTASAASDVDVLVVRPVGVDEHDEQWLESLGAWSDLATRIVGNPVNALVVGELEVPVLLGSRRRLWREIADTGGVLYGSNLEDIGTAA